MLQSELYFWFHCRKSFFFSGARGQSWNPPFEQTSNPCFWLIAPKARPEENLPSGWRPRCGPIPRAGVVYEACAGNKEIPNIALLIQATLAEYRMASRASRVSRQIFPTPQHGETPVPLGKELGPLHADLGFSTRPVVGKSGVSNDAGTSGFPQQELGKHHCLFGGSPNYFLTGALLDLSKQDSTWPMAK